MNVYGQEYNLTFDKHEILSIDDNVEYYFLDKGDIDNDGDIDIVVNYGYFNQENNYVVWMENNENGEFLEKKIIASNKLYYNEILLCDLDNDGDLDLLTTAHLGFTNENEISWNENLGNASFSQTFVIDTVMQYPFRIITADLDGDSFKDIVISSFSEVAIIQNMGNDNFNDRNLVTDTLNSLMDIALFDFDQDSDPDLFVSYFEYGFYLFENVNGHISNNGRRIAPTLDRSSSISFGDIDNDGIPDLILASYNTGQTMDGTLNWLKNDGGFYENEPQIIATYEDLRTCDYAYLQDLDNDGIDDIIAFSFESVGKNISWFPGLGNGQFGNQIVIEGATRFSGDHLVEDLNMDGFPDVVEASTSGIYWFENKRVFTSNETNSNESLPNNVLLAQNYPNPFNPVTKIEYTLNKIIHVKIEIFNITGRKINTLFDGIQVPGKHKISFDAHHLNSGLYFYTITTSEYSITNSMTLIK